MALMRFTLNILRRDGKALQRPEVHPGIYCETHNQISFAWRDEGVAAAKPLHNGVLTIHATGIRLVGFEREGDAYNFQEWWLAPTDAVESDLSLPIPTAMDEPIQLSTTGPTPEKPKKPPADDDEEVFAEIHWDETMCLGDAELDEEHRALFRRANALIHAVENPDTAEGVIGETLQFLQSYMDQHFTREETLMESSGFPGFADHRRIHDKLRVTVERYGAQFDADPAGFDARDFLRFMRRWLVQHVEREDQSVRPYLDTPPTTGERQEPASSESQEPASGESLNQVAPGEGDDIRDGDGAPPSPDGARDALRDALRAVRHQIKGNEGDSQ